MLRPIESSGLSSPLSKINSSRVSSDIESGKQGKTKAKDWRTLSDLLKDLKNADN